METENLEGFCEQMVYNHGQNFYTKAFFHNFDGLLWVAVEWASQSYMFNYECPYRTILDHITLAPNAAWIILLQSNWTQILQAATAHDCNIGNWN